MIYIIFNGNDVVTAFKSKRTAEQFIINTTFHIQPVNVQDMQHYPDSM